MPHLEFDPTINLGTLIVAATFLVGLWRVNNNVVKELTEIKTKLGVLWKRSGVEHGD